MKKYLITTVVLILLFAIQNHSLPYSCEGWNSGYKMAAKNVYHGFGIGGGVTVGPSGPSGGISGSVSWKQIMCCLDVSNEGTGSASACNFDGMSGDCLNYISYTQCSTVEVSSPAER